MDTGRIEYIASVIIAVLVLIAGVTAFKESIEKIINPSEAHYTIVSLLIVLVAVVVKYVFGNYIKKIGEDINAQTLIASGSDAIFDSILSLSTLIAGILNLGFNLSLEGVLGLIISIMIIRSSIEMLKETLNNVIGVRVDSKLSKEIKKEINTYEEVEGTYDLLLHNYGPTQMIGSVHIQIKDDMTAKEIDNLTRKITSKIYSKFGIILTIGIYASNTSDIESINIKRDLDEIINEFNNILQLHGFYVNNEEKKVSFDLIISFEEKDPEKLRDTVVQKIRKKYEDYTFYAIIDNDYSD